MFIAAVETNEFLAKNESGDTVQLRRTISKPLIPGYGVRWDIKNITGWTMLTPSATERTEHLYSLYLLTTNKPEPKPEPELLLETPEQVSEEVPKKRGPKPKHV